MDYYINPNCSLSGAFTVPCSVVDRYFKLSKPEHIKVLLYIFRNMSEIPAVSLIADECGVSEYDVKEALLYWADAEILLPKSTAAADRPAPQKEVVKRVAKPSRSEIARRNLNDPKIQYLLCEAEKRLSRSIKPNEAQSFVWLYDDCGIEISVILLIIQYAVMKNKVNVSFIEKIAAELEAKGIDNVADADAELHKMDLSEKAWQVVCSCFGIEKRKPSKKELEYAVLWVDTWAISKELLTCAYDECIDKKTKLSFPYVAKIIESWHNNGVTAPEDIKSAPKNGRSDFVSYDIDLYEKMLNGKD